MINTKTKSVNPPENKMMRFRKYLGKQYQNPQNAGSNGNPIPIYILGEAFTKEVIPVIRVERNYVDVATGELCHRSTPL